MSTQRFGESVDSNSTDLMSKNGVSIHSMELTIAAERHEAVKFVRQRFVRSWRGHSARLRQNEERRKVGRRPPNYRAVSAVCRTARLREARTLCHHRMRR